MSDFFNGIIVGISQTIIGHPLDTIKTNIQGGKKINILSPYKLYGGVIYPMISSGIINGIMFYSNGGINEYSNNFFISGGLTGLLTSPIINVFDLYKIKTQLGKPIHEVFKRPFIGLTATLARESLATSIYFGSFHQFKENNYNIFLAGGSSGVLSWLLTYPLDVIKTRIQSGEYLRWKCAIKGGNIWNGLYTCLFRGFLVNGVSFTIYNYMDELAE